MFEQRLNLASVAPEARQAIMSVEAYVQGGSLEPALIELVKLRASQMNHCAYCIDKHSKDARRRGETMQRLDLLAAWAESPIYSARERAALAWTEALTLLPQTGAPDEAFAALRAVFSEREIVELTVLVGHINLLNRIGVGFRMQHPVAAHG